MIQNNPGKCVNVIHCGNCGNDYATRPTTKGAVLFGSCPSCGETRNLRVVFRTDRELEGAIKK